MAFRGIYTAPELVPTPCGLLSVARVMKHTGRESDDTWTRGFSYEFESRPTVRLLTVNDDAVSNGELFDGEDVPRFYEYRPFFIEVEDFASTFGLTGEDRIAKILRQLEVATQKAVERELWDGVASTGASNTNKYLTRADSISVVGKLKDSGIATIYTDGDHGFRVGDWVTVASVDGAFDGIYMITDVPTGDQFRYLKSGGNVAFGADTGTATVKANEVVDGPHDAFEALYLLENAISQSPIGGNAVIHMTRDIASILDSRLTAVTDSDGNYKYVRTVLGTKVCIGSGYTGNGPIGDGNATASATNKWMFATGEVDVHLGKSEIVNDSLAQGIGATINDMRIKAFRPAAVYFDPSCFFAVQVTLPNA